MKAFAIALFCAVLAGCAAPLPTSSTPAPTTPPSPTPSPGPSPAISCAGLLHPSGESDPCPAAIAAVEQAVARLGLPIAAMTLVPGPYLCDLWFGPGAAPACIVIGSKDPEMHGWVAFVGSPEVAAVLLYATSLPAASPPPWSWRATVSAFEVPPASFMFPLSKGGRQP